MKLSLASLTMLFTSSAAADFSLRAAFQEMVVSASTESYNARIVVGGLSDMVSDEEANYITKQAQAAYNQAFGFDKAGQKLGDIKTQGFSTIPSDSFWWTPSSTSLVKNSQEEAAFINAQVDVFYYKDSVLGATADLGLLHEQFQYDLCDRLQKSSYVNLVHAKDCTFSFLEHTGLNTIGPVETAFGHGEITEAQLTLIGLPHELSDRDNQILNRVVLKAHNQAFGNSALSLGLFQTVADIAVGGHQGWLDRSCGLCCPYDDDDPRCCCNAKADDATIVVARVAAAAGPIEQVSYRHAKISHGDFEDFVCLELRQSGSATFEHVHDCTFNFVYNPVGKALTKVN